MPKKQDCPKCTALLYDPAGCQRCRGTGTIGWTRDELYGWLLTGPTQSVDSVLDGDTVEGLPLAAVALPGFGWMLHCVVPAHITHNIGKA